MKFIAWLPLLVWFILNLSRAGARYYTLHMIQLSYNENYVILYLNEKQF